LTSQLLQYFSSYVLITGCVKYNSVTGACMECGASQFLDASINSPYKCTNTCNALTSVIILDNLDGAVNICGVATNYLPMIGLQTLINTGPTGITTTLNCGYATRVSVTALTTNQNLNTALITTASTTAEATTSYVCVSPLNLISQTGYNTYYPVL
jgi:hypothetical protein